VIVEDVATDPLTERVRHAGGLRYYRSLYSTPLITHSGKIIGSLANFFRFRYRPTRTEMLLVDLYARHAAEFIDNARLSAALDRKTRELEHFVASVAHDLKEPLRTMAVAAELLDRSGDGLEERARKHVRFLHHGATRMTRLVEDLVGYARLGKTLALRPTDAGALVREVVESLAVPLEEAGATVTVDPLPTVLADARQLALVFQNLVSNAIKFHEPGVPPRVHVGAAPEGGDWRFFVRDNGIGIAPEQQESLFRLFRRLHPEPRFSGSGIGLASAKKIVERHEGRIGVESEPGKGATFWFTLRGA
jgi:light-regulated signal transduction histidine kinase (bacteriophytochrome)